MAYEDNSVYNKYQGGCDCENNGDGTSCDCCSTSSDCSCCPTGTVGIYSEDGKHIGCVTPADAEEYKNGTHIPAEGFIKVIDPATGKYYGDLPYAQGIEYLDFIINGTIGLTANETFNVVTPEVGVSGFYELSYQLADGITADINLLLDRVGITDAVVVSIQNSVEDIQFDPSGTVTNIPLNDSDKLVKFKWTGIAAPGTYTFILRFATTNVTKEVPVRLTLT